ncbi:hypothetical protein [Longispora urticae]
MKWLWIALGVLAVLLCLGCCGWWLLDDFGVFDPEFVRPTPVRRLPTPPFLPTPSP